MKLKQKPNGIYYLDVRLPDATTGELKRARVSLDTRDATDAEAQRRDWLAGRHPKHPAMGGVIAPKGSKSSIDPSTRPTMRRGGMSLERWLWHCIDVKWAKCKSIANIRSAVNVLAPYLPEVEIGDVTSTHVQQVKAALEASGKFAEGSIKKLMTTLGGGLSFATEQENPDTGRSWLAAKPKMPTIKVDNLQERVITLTEERAIFECIEARRSKEPTRPWWAFGQLLMVLFDTGFRLGEALSLGQRSLRSKRWRDKRTGEVMEATYLGLERYSTKNGKPREVPATRRLLAATPALNAQSIAGKWFPWAKGSTGAWYLWTNIRDDMLERGYDLSDVKLHTFRHTCATRLAENGMDLLGLRDWLGHSDIKVTAERYVHLMSSHLYQGAEILDLMTGTVGIPEEIESSLEVRGTMSEYLSCGRDDATSATPTFN
jgi:site-specific recombinase XerD